MQIEVKKEEQCKVQATYIADPEKVDAKRSEVTDLFYKQASQSIVPGYRKGKAPLAAIKLKYRKQICLHHLHSRLFVLCKFQFQIS